MNLNPHDSHTSGYVPLP